MSTAELRKTRMAQGLSLTEISRRTRIGVTHLRRIEEGDFKSLPPGFYARAFVRAYAEAIGVDADIVLGTLADQLPAAQSASSPHPSHPAHPSHQATLPWADAADLIPNARMQVLKQLLERHNEIVANAEPASVSNVLLVPITARGPRRFLAASFDGLLLASIYLLVIGATAVFCGVGIRELLRVAGFAVFMVLALITMLYVMMMGGIAGRTIGAMLLDVPLLERSRSPLGLGAIARRSVDCVRADVAAAADVVTLIPALLGRARRAA
jgi:transcriptional regulator with XRE-family HTH domain